MSEAVIEHGDADLEVCHEQWLADRDQRRTQLRRNARAVFSAMEGWQRVESDEDWRRIYQESWEAYHSGRFLLERLGAERYLEPELMAVLVQMRRALVGPGGGSPSEAMIADLAVLSYHNSLRLQQWIGDLAVEIEREFFGGESPTARFEGRYGRGTGLVVEERLQRLGEQILPLQERANRMMLRNLKALADLRRTPAPAVAIGTAQQVNVGAQQVNVSRDAVPHEDAAMRAESRVRSAATER